MHPAPRGRRADLRAVYRKKIKHPLLFVLVLLAAWLGMTWWLHGDRKPGEPRRDYSSQP